MQTLARQNPSIEEGGWHVVPPLAGGGIGNIGDLLVKGQSVFFKIMVLSEFSGQPHTHGSMHKWS